MLAMNYETYRENPGKFFRTVAHDKDKILVRNEKEGNVIMMSESAYNNLMANLDIRSDPVNYQHILDSVRQMETGQTRTFTAQEWEQLLHEQDIL